MKFMYFFDEKIKPLVMKGTYFCHPAETGVLSDGISCIRQADVNLWFYTKNGVTIAIDAGHLHFSSLGSSFDAIGINPLQIHYVFLTHADVDHCGGVDTEGKDIYPYAQMYLGRREEPYIRGKMHRMTRLGIKIPGSVRLRDGLQLLDDGDIISADGISVRAIATPGHTAGHMCYIVDDKVLFSGDCLAINSSGGYSFPDFFTQFPDLNKQSLCKLRRIVEQSNVRCVCTGHSGMWTDMSKVFAHINKSAAFSRRQPFDQTAPKDIRK